MAVYRPGDDSCHYIRIKKIVTIPKSGRIVPAWVYMYPKDRQRPDFIPVPSGCWREFMKS